MERPASVGQTSGEEEDKGGVVIELICNPEQLALNDHQQQEPIGIADDDDDDADWVILNAEE